MERHVAFLLSQVEITCADAEGKECNQVQQPTLQCPTDVSTLRLRYTAETCADSNNSQENMQCEDRGGGPPAELEVMVSCGANDTVLQSAFVRPGDDITVSGANNGPLPTELICLVTSADGMVTYQEVKIETDESFDLKDQFGSFLVEGCDDNDCMKTVAYSYTLTNIGTAPTNITSVIRERAGESVDLIDTVPVKDLDVNESTVISEMDEVDYCINSVIATTVTVTSDGQECGTSQSMERGERVRRKLVTDERREDILQAEKRAGFFVFEYELDTSS